MNEEKLIQTPTTASLSFTKFLPSDYEKVIGEHYKETITKNKYLLPSKQTIFDFTPKSGVKRERSAIVSPIPKYQSTEIFNLYLEDIKIYISEPNRIAIINTKSLQTSLNEQRILNGCAFKYNLTLKNTDGTYGALIMPDNFKDIFNNYIENSDTKIIIVPFVIETFTDIYYNILLVNKYDKQIEFYDPRNAFGQGKDEQLELVEFELAQTVKFWSRNREYQEKYIVELYENTCPIESIETFTMVSNEVFNGLWAVFVVLLRIKYLDPKIFKIAPSRAQEKLIKKYKEKYPSDKSKFSTINKLIISNPLVNWFNITFMNSQQEINEQISLKFQEFIKKIYKYYHIKAINELGLTELEKTDVPIYRKYRKRQKT